MLAATAAACGRASFWPMPAQAWSRSRERATSPRRSPDPRLHGRRRTAAAGVDDVSFALLPGETLGVVGESGCGKSTLARMILRLIEPSIGAITFMGEDITHLPEAKLRPLRRDLQAVFQDPVSS